VRMIMFARSGPWRPGFPIEGDHRFRWMTTTCSGRGGLGSFFERSGDGPTEITHAQDPRRAAAVGRRPVQPADCRQSRDWPDRRRSVPAPGARSRCRLACRTILTTPHWREAPSIRSRRPRPQLQYGCARNDATQQNARPCLRRVFRVIPRNMAH
jgi:hypothetical protein